MAINRTGCTLPLFLVICILLIGCSRSADPQIEFALGTVCTINLYEGGKQQTYSRIFARIREIDRTMTAFPSGEFQELLSGGGMVEPDSKAAEMFKAAAEALLSGVAAINEQAGIEPVKVRADLIELLQQALYYAELSDGAFDPTVGPLVRLWGIGTDTQRIPDEDEIIAALQLINWRDVTIDRAAGTVFLRREGMALDLGAIAKGYAGDEAARIARENNVSRAIVDLGGNIVTVGWRGQKNKELLPWRIGIQNPVSGRGAYIAIVPVHDTSVVTSGVYERFFIADGKRYHHLFSTANGYPVENGLMSVTIITGSSTAADALSTAVFAMGFERGKELLDSIPGIEAIFVFDDRTVRITDGLKDIFSLTDTDFTLVNALAQ
jgi:thiamine biosynthesis lipoprotein